MKKVFVILFLMFAIFLSAQNSIEGIITDKKNNETLPFGIITLQQHDSIIMGVCSDIEGYYFLESIQNGRYDLVISYIGYVSSKYLDIKIDSSFEFNVELVESKISFLCGPYPFPIPKKPGIIMDDDFSQIRKTNLDEVLLTKSKVIQLKNNELSFKGTRPGSEEYFIDGMRIMGKPNIPISSIYELEILSNGVSAKYGNTTSSIINIKTKSYYDIF